MTARDATWNLGAAFSHEDDRPAIVDLVDPSAPRHFSYGELRQLADGAAAALDIERGAHVGILAENSIEFVAQLFGILRAGGVAVPINYRFPDATIDYIVDDAGLDIVFADARNVDRLPNGVEVRDMACTRVDSFPVVVPEPHEPGLILYTSGSTGRPKGVVLSHDSQRGMAERIGNHLRHNRAIIAAPLYHMNATLMLTMNLYSGGQVVLLPRFEARVYLEAVEAFSVTSITGIPTMLALMLRETDLLQRLDFSSVTSISIGSSPLSATIASQALEVFPNARISNGYGTTEAGAGMFGPHPDGLPTPPISLGYPQGHVEVRLVDGEQHNEGVLEVKTPAAMNEYLNLPDKTSEKTTADGWINTGDKMRRDDDGFYFFVGRDDDMFNCNGENVFPGEVERILEADPRVAEASVVPLVDSIRGHVPVAFVVPAAGADLDEQAVKDIVLQAAPAYMHPRHAVFLPRMPLAGTSKIDRRALETLAAEQIRRDA